VTMNMTENATQATQVEQARAVAEVAASVFAAAERPRDEDLAIARFKRSCVRMEFAQRAFYNYPRGGKRLTDVTIRFAIEAARCWGNMTSGSAEIERRPGQSTVVAFAWDLETNFTRRTTFVSPHSGYTDTPEQGEDGRPRPARTLVAVRDVRENNQSAGSRVERQQILAALPPWFVEMGKGWCAETIAKQGGGKPIEDRRRQMVETFEAIGARREELIRRIGAPVDSWTEVDLATLTVIGQSIRIGESSLEDEFERKPQPRSTTDIMNTLNADQRPDTVEGEAVSTGEPPASRQAVNGILARLGELGVSGRGADVRDRRLAILRAIVDRNPDEPVIGSTNDITTTEAEIVREYLAAATAETLAALVEPSDGGE